MIYFLLELLRYKEIYLFSLEGLFYILFNLFIRFSFVQKQLPLTGVRYKITQELHNNLT